MGLFPFLVLGFVMIFALFCRPYRKKAYLCPFKDAGLRDTGLRDNKKSRVSRLEVSRHLELIAQNTDDTVPVNIAASHYQRVIKLKVERLQRPVVDAYGVPVRAR